MYPIGPSYYNGNDADSKALCFNRAEDIHFITQTTTTAPLPPPGNTSPVSVNSNSSPLSDIYVPNLPIQTTGTESECYHYCNDWGNTSYYREHGYSPTNTSLYSSDNSQWNLRDNYASQHFAQSAPPTRNGRYTDLWIYENPHYMNTSVHFPFNYNNSFNPNYQITAPKALSFVPQKNPVYSQANKTYQHFLINECRPCPYRRIQKWQMENRSTAQHRKPPVVTSKHKNSVPQLVVPVVQSPIITTVDNKQQSKKSHERGKSIADLAFKSSSTTNESQVTNAVCSKANEFLVSLPGGIPLFSVALKNAEPPKKRRGRPPKPKPPPKDPPPKKLRGRRRKSQLHNAPAVLPYVPTVESHQPCSSKTDSDIQMTGKFSNGRVLQENSLNERKETHVSAAAVCTSTSLSTLTIPIESEGLNLARCPKEIADNAQISNAKNGTTTLGENDHSLEISFVPMNLGNDNELENFSKKQKRAKTLSKSQQMTMEKVNAPEKSSRRKKDKLNSNKDSKQSHDKTTQEINAIKPAAHLHAQEMLTISKAKEQKISNVLNEFEIATDEAIIDTSNCAFNNPKCLNMPDIFDLLQESNESNQINNEDAAQAENYLELEEMINLHVNGVPTTNTSSSSTPLQDNQNQTKSGFASLAPTQNYFPSFLSDDSDADSTTSDSNEDLTTSTCNPIQSIVEKQNRQEIIPSYYNQCNGKNSNTPERGLATDIESSVSSRQNTSFLSTPIISEGKEVDSNSNEELEYNGDDTIDLNGVPIIDSETERNIPVAVVINSDKTSGVPSSDAIQMASDLLSNIEPPSNEGRSKSTTEPASPFSSLWEEFISLMETEPPEQTTKWQEKVMENKEAANSSYVGKTSAFVKVIPSTIQKMNTDKSKQEEASGKVNKASTENVDWVRFDAIPLPLSKPSTVAPSFPIFTKPCRSETTTAKLHSRNAFHSVLRSKRQDFPNSFQHFPTGYTQSSPRCFKMLEEKGESYQVSFNEEYKEIMTATSNGGDERARKKEYDEMGNRVVKRMAHRVHIPQELFPQRKILVHTYKRSNGESKEVEQIKSSKIPRSRTNAMIKKLIKFTSIQKKKFAVNETKSKLNAELNKVFVLGNHSCKRKIPGIEKLKEVQLKIPGPMERRPKLSYEFLERKKKDVQKSILPKSNLDTSKKTNEFKKMSPVINNIEPRQPMKKTLLLNLSLSEPEDDDDCPNYLTNSVGSYSKKTACQSQQIGNGEKKESSSVEVHNETYDSDDEDILNIHAERDSALDMFC